LGGGVGGGCRTIVVLESLPPGYSVHEAVLAVDRVARVLPVRVSQRRASVTVIRAGGVLVPTRADEHYGRSARKSMSGATCRG